jgi:hypothetical protein
MFRPLLVLTVLLLCATAALADGNDEEYTKKIREYTTDRMFLTELVDHLPASGRVPTPAKVLGYVAGTPGRLTYAKDVHRYFRELAKASPRVRVWGMGRSEEGREMILVAVSDEANLAQLDRLKAITASLADPRKTPEAAARKLIAQGKPIYWMTGAMHAPETGSPEMLMELGYRLAVEESLLVRAIRKNTIALITPVLEVDGRERMVDLYRYLKDHPGRTPPPLVYWGKYVAHDNNRDGIGLSLKLSRHVMKTALEWHPTVLHDLHESVPYLYISTGTGPYNAWLDPIVVDEWHLLAYQEVEGLTKRGVPGVWTHGFYDGWAPNYMMYMANGRNGIGRFYETFGNLVADTKERTVRGPSERTWFRPNPPLPRVKWSLRNNINLQQSGLLLALKSVADHRERFLDNFYRKSQRSIAKATTEGPAAYVIAGDEPRQAAVADLLRLLDMQGIEVHRAGAGFRLTEHDGTGKGKKADRQTAFPAGSYVIRMDQPYSRMADMLLDTQWYSVDDPRPYDDTGWTLGPLCNVQTVRVTDTAVLKVPMTRVSGDRTGAGGLSGSGSVFVVANRAEGQLATLRFRLKDVAVEAAEEPFEAGANKFAAGSLIIGRQGTPAGLRRRLEQEAAALHLDVHAVATAPHVKCHRIGVPRIALVHEWLGTQDEGWWRIAFDHAEIPYDYISVHALRKTADLRSRWDVLVLAPVDASLRRFIHGIRAADAIPWEPSARYPNLGGPDRSADIRGGAGYEGLAHLQRFVEDGGLLIAAKGSAALAVRAGLVEAVEVVETKKLRAHGGVYRATVLDEGSPIAYGYGETLAVYFNQAPVFAAGPGAAFGAGFGAAEDSRGSGRGGANDADVPQGRPYVAAPAPPKRSATHAELPESIQENGELYKYLVPPEARLPRVVVKFAKKDKLWVSGMLDQPEELAERPMVLDCPAGKGHVVLFANNPIWRGETYGSHALVFNAILHWDHLGAGRSASQAAAKK